MKRLYKLGLAAMAVATFVSSCKENLDLKPTNDITADVAYKDFNGYTQGFAKLYAAYALTGGGGAGSSDLGGIDAGTSDFLRLYWGAQELTTDEAGCVWNDPGVYDLNYNTWTSDNILLRGLYTRSIYQITVCNEFLRESTTEKLSSRGITNVAEIEKYRAEARFLRAYQYWVLMDLFGNPPFVTEADAIGKTAPKQIKRADLFKYVESELKAIESSLAAPKTNAYGRADQAAAWALLARLYLNSEVYLGKGNGRYADAVTYANKVIAAPFQLKAKYADLFKGDNDQNNPETILSINYDGVKSQNWGGMTYLINAAINQDMKPVTFGVPNGGWGGNRSRSTLPKAFGDYSGNSDKRAMFFGDKINIEDMGVFAEGLKVTKFTNITSTGTTPASINGTWASTDFPLFRLGEIYLTYAEAVLRGATNGDMATAISYVNKLRTRAFGNASGQVTTLTLDDVLNERQRELYWEGYRRTDLVRYGKFAGGTYVWPFKGGVKEGRSISENRNLFPIPSSDIIANTNLDQNTGY